MTLARLLLMTGVAIALVSGVLLHFGVPSKNFDLEWDEEVRLHDGRIVLVHIKRTYERRGSVFEKYPERSRLVSMSFRFLRAPGRTFEHTFVRGTLNFLDEKNGYWYIGYHADPGDPSVEIGNRNFYPHVAIVNPSGAIEKPRDWSEVPAEIRLANVMPATPNPKVIASFNGKRLTVAEKMSHWAKYPTGAGSGVIQRITPSSALSSLFVVAHSSPAQSVEGALDFALMRMPSLRSAVIV